MKKSTFLVSIVFIIAIFGTFESFAQRGMKGRGNSGWGMGSTYNKMFNPKTVETISGEVISVEKHTPMKSMSYGIHLVLKSAKETISIHVGPGWYIENQDPQIKVKDTVEVTGSRIMFEGKSVIIATEIRVGDQVLILRDGNGYPVWSGWRHR